MLSEYSTGEAPFQQGLSQVVQSQMGKRLSESNVEQHIRLLGRQPLSSIRQKLHLQVQGNKANIMQQRDEIGQQNADTHLTVFLRSFAPSNKSCA